MEDLLEFAHFVAKEVCCSDEEWANKHWALQEILCRKLAKLGILAVKDDEYIYEFDGDGE